MKRKGNKYVTEGNVTKVYFNNADDYFICDSDVVEKLQKQTWYKTKRGYAMSTHTGNREFAHVCIMGKRKGYEIDHINRNKLDNRRENLRFVTHIENLHNVDPLSLLKGNPATGVSINKSCKSYISYEAYIRVDGKKIHLGCFTALEDAIKARKEAEVFYWGKQANA